MDVEADRPRYEIDRAKDIAVSGAPGIDEVMPAEGLDRILFTELKQRLVAGAETVSAPTPIPPKIVSNGEYLPPPQNETQKRVERRIFELADVNGKRLGLSRRQFMQTSCGMAAAFVAMNEGYATNVFQVAAAEAREPELMQVRAQSLARQFIFDFQ